MNVGTICDQEVLTVCANDRLAEAARLLCEHSVDAVVVVASPVRWPTAIGIITDREILRVILEHGCDLAGLRVLDVLPKRPLVLNQDEEIESALRKLDAARVRYAPVTGVGGTLRGAISQQALLNHRRNTNGHK